MTQKPQPFTIFGLLIMSYIILALGPDLRGDVDQDSALDDYNIKLSSTEPQKTNKSVYQALGTIMYLGLFATHFGSQIWMTFVSGNYPKINNVEIGQRKSNRPNVLHQNAIKSTI